MSYDLSQSPTGGIRFIDSASGAVAGVVLALSWDAARGATNTVEVGTLPANARIIRIDVHNPIVCNAATTANISVGLVGGSATFFSTAQDVKTAIGNFSQAATANWVVATASQRVNCTYTETGAASTTGAPRVTIEYVVN